MVMRVDGFGPETEGQQLHAGDVPVLLPGQSRDQLVEYCSHRPWCVLDLGPLWT
jgi:hypothetical protein